MKNMLITMTKCPRCSGFGQGNFHKLFKAIDMMIIIIFVLFVFLFVCLFCLSSKKLLVFPLVYDQIVSPPRPILGGVCVYVIVLQY